MPSPVYRSLADGVYSSTLTSKGFWEGRVLGLPLNLNYNRSLLTRQFGYDFFFLVNTSMFWFFYFNFTLFIYFLRLSLIEPLFMVCLAKKIFLIWVQFGV